MVFGGDPAYPEIYSIAKFRKANSKRGRCTSSLEWLAHRYHCRDQSTLGFHLARCHRPPIRRRYVLDRGCGIRGLVRTDESVAGHFAGGMRTNHRPGQKIPRTTTKWSAKASWCRFTRLFGYTQKQAKRCCMSARVFCRIPDLSPQESHHVLEMLWNTRCFRNTPFGSNGSPAALPFGTMFDCSLAPRDIFGIDFDRQFYRVTLNGDVPKGVDGKLSEAISGEVIQAV